MTCKDNRDGSCTVEYVPTVSPYNYRSLINSSDVNLDLEAFGIRAFKISKIYIWFLGSGAL